MKRIISTISILSLFSLTFFSQTKQNSNPKVKSEVDIPFQVANNYFVKNTYKKNSYPQAKITTRKSFDAIFGAAAFMGEEGKPTPINFKKQYVIAVIQKETDVLTTITPISLKKNKDKIVLKYSTVSGEKQSATTRPFLLIIVDKKFKGKVSTSNIITEVNIQNNGLSLSNQQWIIANFNNPKRAVTSKNCYININENSGTFTGNDGCNVINGNVKTNGTSIAFENIIGTQMACEKMEEGAVFVKNLFDINKYEIKQGELLLYKNDLLVMTLESYK